ncbi:DUF4235 domain-containing protein [Flexithrix dorotheae]|uniref:DUF4235 domain-containing protein n=1 Tax=Flexithrix dorotheae TaxID=70993 RepID=UPI0003821254|nr:DUF4235 domain-containing protein [Flexithrix dorotheae]
MAITSQNNIWKGLSTVASLATAVVMKKGLSKSFKKVKEKEPPKKSQSIQSTGNFKKLLGWTILSGVVISLGKLATEQGLVTVWKKVTKQDPPA